ncbi:MAG: hypothetical protein UT10_C0015G0033 [Candidatus Woesebacteria bacterium GW2011_GWB1_38_8b]|uniref:Pacifastin domain-containing protein n=1 Tax=Candidatus Woesebacteria bacterium GW2011_GWB1_38_8b TaxID=1618571 RepID=A0A0G0L7A6_9BACT|nr:MAG: hypothetical protein UT10_C0015G0033 [Candidatus Woesebacteria bacterium GW2011_GWB1_38_8b]
MKTASFVIGLLIILAAIFVVVLFRDSKTGLTRSFSDECKYGEETYQLGDKFTAEDGCNTCVCNKDGLVACTLLACD